MSKLSAECFWFCLAFFANILLVQNTVFAADITAALLEIPDAENAIARTEPTNAQTPAASVIAPPETFQSDLTPTSNPAVETVIPSELERPQIPETLPEKDALLQSQPPDAASMNQVTSVSQLSDVRPTDWAFQALQSLVER